MNAGTGNSGFAIVCYVFHDEEERMRVPAETVLTRDFMKSLDEEEDDADSGREEIRFSQQNNEIKRREKWIEAGKFSLIVRILNL
jgi:hypothetical protein